ncbi:hypothetical protein DTO207G8_8919 [Paecilomyces variotii]|nr:hypothetical protein DTO169E5_6300 [Paecilomyces variotii]KAJ9246488.1 hypothetical protein DTO207G8_8919 [Paecilomyces variotii]KAJ9403035.1 hypothetical protein DTO282F9_445 [Paecilomyces variotii]
MAPAIYRPNDIDIIDIRQEELELSLGKEIVRGLNPQDGRPRSLPTILLYDTEGLKLFEQITYLEDYYLTNAEIEVLLTHARSIVDRIPDNAQLIELGSGNLRKIEILLKEFEQTRKKVDYYALDLSLEELQRTFSEVSASTYAHVRFHGLHGTYDDALTWLKNPDNRKQPTCVLSMGSSIGNFSRDGAAAFLRGFSELLGPSDSMLIGLDACKVPEKVYRAYNDREGITHKFYMNGLVHANVVLGVDAFKLGQWQIVSAYDENEGRHRAFYSPAQDVSINGTKLRKGEKIIIEEAFKYSAEESEELWRKAGLIPVTAFGSSSDEYHIHMLSPGTVGFPSKVAQYAAQPIPGLSDWQALWLAWDIVTKGMIPKEELMSKPIKLRNALIFYLGHIPTFLDIHLTRGLHGKPTEPKYYQSIFERGIDPDVDDPEQCHSHSEIPDEWPPVSEVLDYQDRVRARVKSLLKLDSLAQNRLLGEAMWLSFEHEAMHLETFLYMLLQSERTLPPPGVSTPNFRDLCLQARRDHKPNEWFTIPEQKVNIGLDDPNPNEVPQAFGWDNEKPQRTVVVPAFEAKARPITNGEFAHYMQENRIKNWPASWIPTSNESNGSIASNSELISKLSVRTVFGPVPLELAADWPVIASYDELAGYAEWKNCRLPTFEEARSIYKHSALLKSSTVDGAHRGSNHIDGIDGTDSENGKHASNANTTASNGNSHEVNPPGPRCPDHQPVQRLSHDTMPVFLDLDGCNVGLRHWHPTPVTQNGDHLAGQGELGGVWEWTSTPLMPHDGFKAMEVYPGYTSDFFDGKHNIVLGGSWSTHPRIAGRTTFVNWYQRNYPYAWVGARLVRDI